MRILAIDPGASTGFAFSAAKDRVERSGVWSLGSLPEARPGRLADCIHNAVKQLQVEVIAYEIATMGGRNLHAMRRLNELAGAVQAAAHECGCTAWAFGITSWKARAVGNGHAKKPAVIRGLRTYFGIDVSRHDEADAIGILLAAQMGPPPESKKAALKRLRKAAKRDPKLF